MSSPLAKFRKHQKILLAVFGVAIIIAFVVLPNAMKMLDNPGGGFNRDEVVLTWVEGDISRGQLEQMVNSYRALTKYLQETQQTMSLDRQPQARLLRPPTSQTVEQQEQSTVRTMLLAKKADQLGIVVSDKVVKDYIKRWTAD